jgi:hypothetical protein
MLYNFANLYFENVLKLRSYQGKPCGSVGRGRRNFIILYYDQVHDEAFIERGQKMAFIFFFMGWYEKTQYVSV